MQNAPCYPGMTPRPLGVEHDVFIGMLPASLCPSDAHLDILWALHPAHHSVIRIHGRDVPIPRWQQAFGRDYHFAGATSTALPVPASLQPWLDWARRSIDERLDGLLLNWYDGALGHYIGPHRDKTQQLVQGAPIVTLSFGEERCLRFRPWKNTGCIDIAATNGSAILIPWATNLAWTHEVPKTKRARGRRISITMRAFAPD